MTEAHHHSAGTRTALSAGRFTLLVLLRVAASHSAGERCDEQSQRDGESNLTDRRRIGRTGCDARHDTEHNQSEEDEYVTEHELKTWMRGRSPRSRQWSAKGRDRTIRRRLKLV